ncbi:phosphomannomutase/phosphoglucomutase [Pendulispora albinea]|uniref:Phosphomannomutase/phosphoglucomutase n=1 Tax=Pendulispora albinea TaxID=2741071 RepID=A0ABZ2LXC7_9BACT
MSFAPLRHIFREYDIRGVADRDLSDSLATALGRGLGTMLANADGSRTRLALGRDCRLSSPRLHDALIAGLTQVGIDVVDIGIVPTPLLYFAVHHLHTDGGIQITGSHNPGEDNGFKIMKGKASFYGPDIVSLFQLIEAQENENVVADRPGALEIVDVLPAYIEAVKARIKLPANVNLPFVVDAGNGAGGPTALAVMHALGLKPDPLYCEMDGRFPNHHPDPTVLANVQDLIDRVRTTGARVGIAYDGDADRLGAVDANGEVVWGDKLMILFSRALLKENPGAAILGEVKCSQTLYDDIAAQGGKPIMWKTGHSIIKSKMKESGALLAGEMSGHLFFADRYFGYDDAIYASLRLLEILANDGRSLGEMLSDVPTTFSTPELRVDCPDAIKFDVVRAVTEHYKKSGREVIDIDGARIQFGKPGEPAWGLVRASNTGPVLVLRFEATTAEERDRIRAEVEATVLSARQTTTA